MFAAGSVCAEPDFFYSTTTADSLLLCDDLPSSFVIDTLTYTTDSLFARQELEHLLGCKDGVTISRAALQKGLQRLYQKKKFASITVGLKKVGQRYHLHLDFVALWLFSKIICKGMLVNRDRYKHLYLLEPGEPFDMHKHQDSLARIQEAFATEGYLNSKIVDTVSYDPTTKTVTVSVDLYPGNQFLVHSVVISSVDNAASDSENSRCIRKLSRLLLRELRGAVCSKNSIEAARYQAQELCAAWGFLQPELSSTIEHDVRSERATIIWSIELGDQKKIEFFGNHFFSDKQLQDHVMAFGRAVLFLPSSMLIEDIIELYKKYGFWQVAVSCEEEPSRCVFCITEGPRMRISEVVVTGAHFAQSFFDRHAAELLRAQGFDQKLCTRMRNAIMQAYVSQGFWDCTIGPEDFQQISHNQYRLLLTIHEGRQRFLRSVSVEGCDELPKELCTASYAKSPIPFDIHFVQEQRRLLLNHLQENGYLYAAPQPELRETEGGVIDVVWHIGGNAHKVQFGHTIVAGSMRLPTEIIMRELAYVSGETWDQKKVDRSLERLKALKIFETVRCYPVDVQGEEAQQDIVFDCFEDDPFELALRAGAQFIGRDMRLRALSFRAGGSFFWKNPSNHGDYFLCNADVTGYTRNVVGTYQRPWLFDVPITAQAKGYSICFDQPVAPCSRERLYQLEQNGFLASVMYDHSDQGSHQIGCSAGVEWMELSHLSRRVARAIDFAPRLIDKKVPYFFTEPTAMASFLDDAANPSVGFVSLFSCKLMAPLQHIDRSALKFLFEEQVFIPVSSQTVLALRLRAGHIFNQAFSEIMPSERFYIGGSHSLRSYQADLAPPLNPLIDRDECVCLVPIGGKSVVNATIELRCNIYNGLGMVLFTDCGALAQDDGFATITAEKFLGATGFGLRYATPVGPLRFDIGWKWHRLDVERHSFAWFLTLGNSF